MESVDNFVHNNEFLIVAILIPLCLNCSHYFNFISCNYGCDKFDKNCKYQRENL